MKIRQGFVSNSSSSSFCIYGVCIKEDHSAFDSFKDKLKEKLIDELEENELQFIDDYVNDAFSDEIYELGHEAHRIDGYWYIGDSPCSCGDDETMGEFKKRIREELKQELKGLKDKDFTIHEGEYYC